MFALLHFPPLFFLIDFLPLLASERVKRKTGTGFLRPTFASDLRPIGRYLRPTSCPLVQLETHD